MCLVKKEHKGGCCLACRQVTIVTEESGRFKPSTVGTCPLISEKQSKYVKTSMEVYKGSAEAFHYSQPLLV